MPDLSFSKKIRLLIVDDSFFFRTVLKNGLDADPRIEVVGMAADAEEAFKKIRELNPDVVTMDVEMPKLNGIDFIKRLIPVHPVPVVVVSSLPLRVLDALEVYHPQQIEFARLNLTHTVLSKRKLIQLVKEGYVKGWDDPRMPTLSGLRRRGVPPEALREFCSRIGIARSDSMVDYAVLEFCIREYLNAHTPRAMAVLDPVKVVIENYPEDQVEEFEMPWHPEDAAYGSRTVPFSRELWIERDDFRQDPPKKYHRLAPGAEVRLRYAYFITCREAVYDDAGNLVELRCTYDPESRGG